MPGAIKRAIENARMKLPRIDAKGKVSLRQMAQDSSAFGGLENKRQQREYLRMLESAIKIVWDRTREACYSGRSFAEAFVLALLGEAPPA